MYYSADEYVTIIAAIITFVFLLDNYIFFSIMLLERGSLKL